MATHRLYAGHISSSNRGLVVQGRAGAGAGSQSHLKHTTHHTRYDQYTSHTLRTVHCGDTLIVHKFQKGEFPFVKMVFLSRPNLKKKIPHDGTQRYTPRYTPLRTVVAHRRYTVHTLI